MDECNDDGPRKFELTGKQTGHKGTVTVIVPGLIGLCDRRAWAVGDLVFSYWGRPADGSANWPDCALGLGLEESRVRLRSLQNPTMTIRHASPSLGTKDRRI